MARYEPGEFYRRELPPLRAVIPLHVTAAGLPMADAARLVSEMAGRFRLPDAIRLADQLARGVQRLARFSDG